MAAQDPQVRVAELVASHGEQLRRFLLARVRNAADVPDIVQEVFLRMLRVPDFESIRSPEAYLFTVAQHVLQQHGLRQSATPPSIELTRMLNPLAASDADPALEVDAQQCLQTLQDTLDEFSPKDCVPTVGPCVSAFSTLRLLSMPSRNPSDLKSGEKSRACMSSINCASVTTSSQPAARAAAARPYRTSSRARPRC